MARESKIYYIEIKGKNVQPNLSHLEEELKKIGFNCTIPLKDLQDGKNNSSQIKPSYLGSSHIRKDSTGVFEMVVAPRDRELEKFADEYEPQPLS